jgi:DNA-directed RNA polymerase specialized sigma24 family protein
MDPTAFSDFYSRTSRSLWSYVYHVTGNATDVDDILQESFCRLLRGGPDADEEQYQVAESKGPRSRCTQNCT